MPKYYSTCALNLYTLTNEGACLIKYPYILQDTARSKRLESYPSEVKKWCIFKETGDTQKIIKGGIIGGNCFWRVYTSVLDLVEWNFFISVLIKRILEWQCKKLRGSGRHSTFFCYFSSIERASETKAWSAGEGNFILNQQTHKRARGLPKLWKDIWEPHFKITKPVRGHVDFMQKVHMRYSFTIYWRSLLGGSQGQCPFFNGIFKV